MGTVLFIIGVCVVCFGGAYLFIIIAHKIIDLFFKKDDEDKYQNYKHK